MGPDFEEVDDEEEQNTTLKLPLFSSSIALAAAAMDSPERPGMRTPPLHTSAAVPFRWEEEPGKPKPCTALITLPSQSDASARKCLELPPRLLLVDPLDHHTTATTSSSQTTKVSSSPNTVLEGPYYVGRSCRFQTPFRHVGGECYGSFRKSPPDAETDHDQLGGVVLSRNNSKRLQRDKGVFGSWRKKKSHYNYKREVGVGGGSYVFPSSVDRYSECSREEEGTGTCPSSSSCKITRSGSFSTATSTTAVSPARPRFWASVYGGLKKVVPWRSKKAKKDGLLGLS